MSLCVALPQHLRLTVSLSVQLNPPPVTKQIPRRALRLLQLRSPGPSQRAAAVNTWWQAPRGSHPACTCLAGAHLAAAPCTITPCVDPTNHQAPRGSHLVAHSLCAGTLWLTPCVLTPGGLTESASTLCRTLFDPGAVAQDLQSRLQLAQQEAEAGRASAHAAASHAAGERGVMHVQLAAANNEVTLLRSLLAAARSHTQDEQQRGAGELQLLREHLQVREPWDRGGAGMAKLKGGHRSAAASSCGRGAKPHGQLFVPS